MDSFSPSPSVRLLQLGSRCASLVYRDGESAFAPPSRDPRRWCVCVCSPDRKPGESGKQKKCQALSFSDQVSSCQKAGLSSLQQSFGFQGSLTLWLKCRTFAFHLCGQAGETCIHKQRKTKESPRKDLITLQMPLTHLKNDFLFFFKGISFHKAHS